MSVNINNDNNDDDNVLAVADETLEGFNVN